MELVALTRPAMTPEHRKTRPCSRLIGSSGPFPALYWVP